MQEDRTEIIQTPPTTKEVSEVQAAPHGTEVRESSASTIVPRNERQHVDAVAYDPYEGRRLTAYRLTQFVYWIFGLLEGLIAIRLILKALGANPSAGFSEFIYGITAPLVAPFVGLFTNPSYQGTVLELSSIVALIVYTLLAWVIAKLLWIVLGETRSAVQTHSSHIDSRI
jgi:uncharacterized protein YggT (Ycf19 family)